MLAPPNDPTAMINALRGGPPGMQVAGEVVPFMGEQRPFTTGESAPTLEAQQHLMRNSDPTGRAVQGIGRDTIMKWLTSPSSQGKVYNPPPAQPPLQGIAPPTATIPRPMVAPPPMGGPPMPGGPGMPRPGGNLTPFS